MAKRMRDSRIWSKKWFQDLSPNMKLFVGYLDDQCHFTGVWDVNFREAEFYMGVDITNELDKLPEGFYYSFDNGEKWFLPKFIERQNGDIFKPLEGDKKEAKVVTSIKKHLSQLRYNDELSLLDLYALLMGKQTHTLPLTKGTKEEVEEKEYIGKGGTGEKPIPSEDAVKEFQNAKEKAQPLIDFWNIHPVQGKKPTGVMASFIMWHIRENTFDEFSAQFEAYKSYKQEAEEKIHGWARFIGDVTENYSNGAWCEHDWTKKLNQLRESAKKDEPTFRLNFKRPA